MTMLPTGLLQAAVVLAPAALLRRLADSETAGEQPVVRVHLTGGQVLDGRPLRVGADRGQEALLLATAGGDELSYVLLANVVAVEVRSPQRCQDVLTEGRLAQPVTGEPVTRLALRREHVPTEGFPLQVDWGALPDSGPLLANLDRLLRSLREIARDVAADEMGMRAWAQVGTLLVEHRDGVTLSVHRLPDGLAVRADLTAALPRDLSGELGRQIDALL